MSGIREDARVLLLSIPPPETVAALSHALAGGLAVLIGQDEAVRAARRHFAHLENVMLVPATPAEIPWQSDFFTDVIVENHQPARVLREIARVLAPEGIARLGFTPEELPPSLEMVESGQGYAVLRRRLE